MFGNFRELRAHTKTRNMAEYSRFLIFRELDNQPLPGTENRSVGGSIPPLGTILDSLRFLAEFGTHTRTGRKHFALLRIHLTHMSVCVPASPDGPVGRWIGLACITVCC